MIKGRVLSAAGRLECQQIGLCYNSTASSPNPGSHASSICKVQAVLGVGHMGVRALRPRRIVPFLTELAFKAAWTPQRVSAMMPKSRTWSKIGENE